MLRGILALLEAFPEESHYVEVLRELEREREEEKEGMRARGGSIRRYTPAICISISPGKCVIHGKRSRTSRKQRVIRARSRYAKPI